MNLTRRGFIGAVMSIAPALFLTGCEDSFSYSIIKNYNYKFVIFNMKNNDRKERLRDLGHEAIFQLENERIMLVYEFCFNKNSYVISKWELDGDRVDLTNKFLSVEEAWKQFRSIFNIVDEIDAISLLGDEYGIKHEYTLSEIKTLMDKYDKEEGPKTFKKTAK